MTLLSIPRFVTPRQGRPRLADFGLATHIHSTSSEAFVASPRGSSPAVVDKFSTSPSNDALMPQKPKSHHHSGFPSLGPSFSRARSVLHAPHPRLASSPFPFLPESSSPIPSNPPSPGPPAFPPGSLPYAAPELLRPPPRHEHSSHHSHQHHHHHHHHDKSASTSNASQHHHSHHPSTPFGGPTPAQDVWALGVLLYFLLTSGSLPFHDAFEPRLQMRIIRGEWEMPGPNVIISKEAEDLMKGCLQVEMENRWEIGKVRGCEWVEGWGQVRSKSRSRSRQRMAGEVIAGEGSRSRSRPGAGQRRSSLSRSFDNGGIVYPPSRSPLLTTSILSTSPTISTAGGGASRSRSRGRSVSTNNTSASSSFVGGGMFASSSSSSYDSSCGVGGIPGSGATGGRSRSRSRSINRVEGGGSGSGGAEERRGRARGPRVEGSGDHLAIVEEERRGRQYRM